MNEQAKDSLNVFQRKVRFYPPPKIGITRSNGAKYIFS